MVLSREPLIHLLLAIHRAAWFGILLRHAMYGFRPFFAL